MKKSNLAQIVAFFFSLFMVIVSDQKTYWAIALGICLSFIIGNYILSLRRKIEILGLKVEFLHGTLETEKVKTVQARADAEQMIAQHEAAWVDQTRRLQEQIQEPKTILVDTFPTEEVEKQLAEFMSKLGSSIGDVQPPEFSFEGNTLRVKFWWSPKAFVLKVAGIERK